MNNDWLLALRNSTAYKENLLNMPAHEFTEWLRTMHLQYLQDENAHQAYGQLVNDTKRLVSEIHEHCERARVEAQEKQRKQEECMDRFFLHECNGQCQNCRFK